MSSQVSEITQTPESLRAKLMHLNAKEISFDDIRRAIASLRHREPDLHNQHGVGYRLYDIELRQDEAAIIASVFDQLLGQATCRADAYGRAVLALNLHPAEGESKPTIPVQQALIMLDDIKAEIISAKIVNDQLVYEDDRGFYVDLPPKAILRLGQQLRDQARDAILIDC